MKYRIVKRTTNKGNARYYLQERYWWWFWTSLNLISFEHGQKRVHYSYLYFEDAEKSLNRHIESESERVSKKEVVYERFA